MLFYCELIPSLSYRCFRGFETRPSILEILNIWSCLTLLPRYTDDLCDVVVSGMAGLSYPPRDTQAFGAQLGRSLAVHRAG